MIYNHIYGYIYIDSINKKYIIYFSSYTCFSITTTTLTTTTSIRLQYQRVLLRRVLLPTQQRILSSLGLLLPEGSQSPPLRL